jgi:cellulose synthase/poly-beta-1,6-N-acetylglucosamine synthase-like glycosyltransferase
MLDEIGGYDESNITEDHEIAYRIHKAGYKIENAIHANVYTTIPETFKATYIQRRRWYAGSIQTLFKHKDVLFNKKYKLFGYYIPYHYTLITIGLITFISSIILLIKKYVDYFIYYSYTHFNFFDHLKWSTDLLSYGRINLVGFSMFAMTFFLFYIGMRTLNKDILKQKTGAIGYMSLFILYQIFWIGAIWAVIKNKKIRWR